MATRGGTSSPTSNRSMSSWPPTSRRFWTPGTSRPPVQRLQHYFGPPFFLRSLLRTPVPQCRAAWSTSRRSLFRADWRSFGFVVLTLGPTSGWLRYVCYERLGKNMQPVYMTMLLSAVWHGTLGLGLILTVACMFLSVRTASCHPPHAVAHALRSVRTDRMLIGACNPMLCSVHVPRPVPRLHHDLYDRSTDHRGQPQGPPHLPAPLHARGEPAAQVLLRCRLGLQRTATSTLLTSTLFWNHFYLCTAPRASCTITLLRTHAHW